MNRIEVNYTLCTPAPRQGYKVFYRVADSADLYTDAGNFFTSPAVFYDRVNPAGTCYEGYIASDCGEIFGTHVTWNSCDGPVSDNSSCGTSISTSTADTNYVDLGLFDLHVDGSTAVDIDWATYDRPNRFTIYEDGGLIVSTGWRGYASYGGPWGSSLSTPENGTMSFAPIPGRMYTVRIEVGPAEPLSSLSDSFVLDIRCT